MYEHHFGLQSEPFALTPDPAFLYLGPDHAEALAGLRIGIESRRGLMAMIGEVGMGKTTLLHALLNELGPTITTAYISASRLGFDDLLRQALAEFGVASDGRGRLELLRSLNSFLYDSAVNDRIAALVIDEAHNLDDDVFENVRLLSNFETHHSKLLQIVLVGQPELAAKLRQPHLRQVAERVAVRCHINPLSRAESHRYIDHRLSCVGGSSATLFTAAALWQLVHAARGLPRRINILTHNALLFSYGRDETQVSWAAVRAAVRERNGLGLRTIGAHPSRWSLAGARQAILACAARLRAPRARRTIRAYAARARAAALRLPRRPIAACMLAALAVLGWTQWSGGSRRDAAGPSFVHAAVDERLDAAIAAMVAATPDFTAVRVVRSTSLEDLVREIYGGNDPSLVQAIREANPQLARRRRIGEGAWLRIPILKEDG
jgi:type II secretory pathway predicted ATPase ExeA